MHKSMKRSTAQSVWAALLFATMAAVVFFQAAAHADDDFLEPEAAFRFSARMSDPKTVEVSYAIADGYYMYRDRFAIKADGAVLGSPAYPPAQVKFDDTFQKNVEIYHHNVTIRVPVTVPPNDSFTLKVIGQGCADKGLCYAPMESTIRLSPKRGGLLMMLDSSSSPSAMSQSASNRKAGGDQGDTEMGRIETSLKSGRLLAVVPLFILLGLGLSFTPCVLPMVPILSSIIVGEGAEVSRLRAFTLSAMYAIGMALVYTAFGIAAGLLGESLAASLQNAWVLGAFSLLMVALSLSMFGVYQLQVPGTIQNLLMRVSGRQSSGRLLGGFVMGAISALIVGPCVAAPLAGALLYISQTHDVVIGGSALFAMAVGMSVPLLLVGVSAGTLLPRAGAWMQTVKNFFGVLMLALALWIVSPVLPGGASMVGWAALGLVYGGYLLWSPRSGGLAKIGGLLFTALGIVQAVGVATGGHDALAPWAQLTGKAHESKFKRVHSVADLDAAIAQAHRKTVMLDFYADWCVSCKEMEKLTFTDPRIQAQLAKMLLLQADVTANNVDDKALLKHFHLFGPPGIIFFDKQGSEIPGTRVIGYQDADRFLRSLERASGL